MTNETETAAESAKVKVEELDEKESNKGTDSKESPPPKTTSKEEPTTGERNVTKEPPKTSQDIKPYPAQREANKPPQGEVTPKPPTPAVSETQSTKEKPKNSHVDKPYPTQREATVPAITATVKGRNTSSKTTTPSANQSAILNENGKRSAVSQIADVEPMDIDDFYRTQVQLASLPEPPPPPAPEMPLQVLDGDVIFGRGGTSNHHRGNIRYRMLVKTYQRIYLQAKRHDKPKIAMLIVDTIRREKGRFLKKNDTTQQWHDVGNSKAREKTSQALREKAPEIRAENGFSKYPTKREKAKSPFMGLGVVTKGMNFGDADTAMLIATRQALANNNNHSSTPSQQQPSPKKRKIDKASLEEISVSEELRALREKMTDEKPKPSKPSREI